MRKLIYADELKKTLSTYQNTESKIFSVSNVISIIDHTHYAPIDYHQLSNAMLKLWMEHCVTDSEYNRIMDKLNSKYINKEIS